MAIITTAYFRGEIALGASTDDLTALTNTWIPRYETEYLYMAMGYAFASEFIAGIAAGTPEQKWIDIRDGKTYTVNDKTYRWHGLKDVITYKSPIAMYVYCLYMVDNATATMSIGEASPNVQNAGRASAATKIHKAWCNMLEMNESLYHFLNNNKDTYTTWDYSDVKCFGSLNSFNI